MTGYARARPSGHWLDYPDTTYGFVGSAEFDTWDTAVDELKNVVLNVKDYGAVGDGSTDDATAFAAAIAVARAAAAMGGTGTTTRAAVPVVFVPYGTYLLGTAQAIDFKGFRMIGAGTLATRIIYNGSSAAFSFGTYSATPADTYGGTAQDYEFVNLTLRSTTYEPTASEASRPGVGVQDNGSGGGRFTNVVFQGFGYGFKGAYGSDFTTFDRCDFVLCDVGCYLGPGSQQNQVSCGNFYTNREGLILEGCAQGSARDNWFILNSVADIGIEGNTTARSGVSGSLSGAQYDMGWSFDDNWHETNAGGLGRICPANIVVKGSPPSIIKHFTVRKPYLVSGGTPSVANSFFDLTGVSGNGAADVTLDGLVVNGAQIAYAVKSSGGTVARMVQRSTAQTDGYSGLGLWDTQSSGFVYVDDYLGRRTNAAAVTPDSWRQTGDTFNRVAIKGDGSLNFGTGAAASAQAFASLDAVTLGYTGNIRFRPPNAGVVPADVMRFDSSQTGALFRLRKSDSEGGAVLSTLYGSGAADFPDGVATAYKSGAGKTTVVDGDFTNPLNGMIAVHRDTTASKTYVSVRAAGAWVVIAGPL